MSVHLGIPSHLPAYCTVSIASDAAKAVANTVSASTILLEISGSMTPRGTNMIMLPMMVRRQNRVVDGCPGFGTKHLIDRITGKRLIPERPLVLDRGVEAIVRTPTRMT